MVTDYDVRVLEYRRIERRIRSPWRGAARRLGPVALLVASTLVVIARLL